MSDERRRPITHDHPAGTPPIEVKRGEPRPAATAVEHAHPAEHAIGAEHRRAAVEEHRDRIEQGRQAPITEEHGEISLFPREEAEGFRSRWEAIQTGFVDEPKSAVAEADALVTQVVTRLSQVFTDEKGTLERQWDRGDAVSTEDLRMALKRYRVFFHRLLSV